MSSTEIKVRKVVNTDLPYLADLQVSTLPNDLASRLGQSALLNVIYPAVLSRDVASSVIEIENQIKGFALLTGKKRIIRDVVTKSGFTLIKVVLRAPTSALGGFFSSVFSPKIDYDAELHWVCVDEKVQRRGLGRQLVNSILETAKSLGIQVVLVRTLTATPQNVEFYTSIGFRIVATKVGRVWLVKDVR